MTQEYENLQDMFDSISNKFTIPELSLPEICLAVHDQLIRMQEWQRLRRQEY